jgi:hypothetical protein
VHDKNNYIDIGGQNSDHLTTNWKIGFKNQKAKFNLQHYDLYSTADTGWGSKFKFIILNFNENILKFIFKGKKLYDINLFNVSIGKIK